MVGRCGISVQTSWGLGCASSPSMLLLPLWSFQYYQEWRYQNWKSSRGGGGVSCQTRYCQSDTRSIQLCTQVINTDSCINCSSCLWEMFSKAQITSRLSLDHVRSWCLDFCLESQKPGLTVKMVLVHTYTQVCIENQAPTPLLPFSGSSGLDPKQSHTGGR